MRLLIAALFVTIATGNAFCQENPLAELTVASTRLSCSSGFAEVTYGYRRGKTNADSLKLKFIVIQTAKYNPRFTSSVHLSSKVDDVTPPAYIALSSDAVVDLPHDHQIHAVTDSRYYKADSDVTLGEIRGWLDQPKLQATIKSLLDYKTKSRTANRNSGG